MDNPLSLTEDRPTRMRDSLARPVSRSATRHSSAEPFGLGPCRDLSTSDTSYVCDAVVRPRPHQLARRLSAYECQLANGLPLFAQTAHGGELSFVMECSHQSSSLAAPSLHRHGGGSRASSALVQPSRSQPRDSAATAAAANLMNRSHSMIAASQHPFGSAHGGTAMGDTMFGGIASPNSICGSASKRSLHIPSHTREPSYLALPTNPTSTAAPRNHAAAGIVTCTAAAAAGAHAASSMHGPGVPKCPVTAAAAAAASTALRKSHHFHPLSLSRPHHSCFHLAWVGGCTVYVAAFAPAALLPVIRPQLQLSLGQVGAAAVAALVASVFTRFLMAVLVRRYGPRYCQVLTLLYTGPVLACMTLVTGGTGFVLMRFLLGASLGLFVVAQCWVVAMFDWSVLRTAVNSAAGLVSSGGGLVMLLVPLLYIGVRPLYGGSDEAAWRATFHILAAACIVIAVLTLMFGQDTPSGDLLDPKPALPANYYMSYRIREKPNMAAAAASPRRHPEEEYGYKPAIAISPGGAAAAVGTFGHQQQPYPQLQQQQPHMLVVEGPGPTAEARVSPGGGQRAGGGGGGGLQEEGDADSGPALWRRRELQQLLRRETSRTRQPLLRQAQQQQQYIREQQQQGSPPQQQQHAWEQQPPLHPHLHDQLQQRPHHHPHHPHPPHDSHPQQPQQQPHRSHPHPPSHMHHTQASPAPCHQQPQLHPQQQQERPSPPAAVGRAKCGAQVGDSADVPGGSCPPPPLGGPPAPLATAEAATAAPAAAGDNAPEPSLLRSSIAAAAAAAASNHPQAADPTPDLPLLSDQHQPPHPPRTSTPAHRATSGGGGGGSSKEGAAGAAAKGVTGPLAATSRGHLSQGGMQQQQGQGAGTPRPRSTTGGSAGAVRRSGDMGAAGEAGAGARRSSASGGSEGSGRSSDSGAAQQRLEEHVHLYGIVLRNPICWILAFNNGFTFGVQLVVFNVLPIYLTDVFRMGVMRAGCVACVFGLSNIVTRVSGCQLSDGLSRRYGMRGRLWLLWGLQAAGGVFCALLASVANSSFGGTVVLLILFAVSIQLACGVMFSITPFVSYRGYAVVAAAVAAGGQVGAAVLQGAFFTQAGFSYNRGFQFMGIASVVASASLLLLRFPMWGGMLAGPSDTQAHDEWAEERYYAREWSEMERAQGLAEAAAGFAWLAKAERPPRRGLR
ncbi:hypothetical protein Agub_g10344, partial [Astrephomene gubernaculifera]